MYAVAVRSGDVAAVPEAQTLAMMWLGLGGVLRPLSTSCADHMGSSWARVHSWDGAKWNFSSDWMQADEQIIKPMVKQAADKYAAEKKLERRTPADCQS